ncbi:MAG: hypothetical protein IT249_02050 [Chitinophagaceae bacterium]|nr:hypothetical protein [Chitinophagaceae bacterium]
MQQQKLTEQESLKLISKMIYEAKGYYYENGMSALIYGFSILICSLLSFLVAQKYIWLPLNPFYILVPIFFVQAWIQRRQEKQKKAKTFTDETIDYVWIGFFLSCIAALSALFAGVDYLVISFILILLGFATLLTGLIAKFPYHIVSAIVCLLMAAGSFFLQNQNSYLVLATAAGMIWIIPGFMLRSKFKKILKTEKNIEY